MMSRENKEKPIWLKNQTEKSDQKKIIEAEEKRKTSKLPLGLAWFVKCLRLYNTFGGRARRKELLFYRLWAFVFYLSLEVLTGGEQGLPTLLTILFFLPDLAVSIRRFHDAGKSGWWILVPIVNLYFFLFVGSQKGTNKYGENPNEGWIEEKN